jgi:hypothetical protein
MPLNIQQDGGKKANVVHKFSALRLASINGGTKVAHRGRTKSRGSKRRNAIVSAGPTLSKGQASCLKLVLKPIIFISYGVVRDLKKFENSLIYSSLDSRK